VRERVRARRGAHWSATAPSSLDELSQISGVGPATERYGETVLAVLRENQEASTGLDSGAA
jgi:hypothetical protein